MTRLPANTALWRRTIWDPTVFLRLFGKTNEEAVDVINSMTADQLYEDLTNRLPVAETRAYVAKVARMKGHYAALQ